MHVHGHKIYSVSFRKICKGGTIQFKGGQRLVTTLCYAFKGGGHLLRGGGGGGGGGAFGPPNGNPAMNITHELDVHASIQYIWR